MLKRCFDIAVAGLALLVLSPLLILVAIAIRGVLGSPVLFRQRRPGWRGRPFELIKFRTMRNATDANGRPLPDKQRLTRFGRVLRATSLDELPELWNIVRGDMSLVGPRPLLMEYLPLYSDFQSRRHEVRPGLTGLAQVSGRNALDWQTRFELDVEYVDTQTFWLDIKILCRTVAGVVTARGVNAPGQATVGKFEGNRG